MSNRIKGTVSAKKKDRNEIPFLEIGYTDEQGIPRQCISYKYVEDFQINDTIYFKLMENGGKQLPQGYIILPQIGKIEERKTDCTWIKDRDGRTYPCYRPITPNGGYVSFFLAKSATNPTSVEVIPTGDPEFFPQRLLDAEPVSDQRNRGFVISAANDQYIEISAPKNAEHTYRCYDPDRKWFFKGDQVTFDITPSPNNPKFSVATNLKKQTEALPLEALKNELVQAARLLELPIENSTLPNPLQLKLIQSNNEFRKTVRNIENTFSQKSIAVWTPSKSIFTTVFGNITEELYLSRFHYQSLLERFKPLYDKLVPLLYVIELKKAPARLNDCMLDYCGFLSTVLRAQRNNDPSLVVIDREDYFYEMLARIVKHFILESGASVDDQVKLELLLALANKPFWQEEDTLRLLACGSASPNPLYALYQGDQTQIKALYEKAPEAGLVGKCCDLIQKRSGKTEQASDALLRLLALALDLCGRNELDGFVALERSENEALLQNSYDAVLHLANSDQEPAHLRPLMSNLADYIAKVCLGQPSEETDEPLLVTFSPEDLPTDVANAILDAFNEKGLEQWGLDPSAPDAESLLLEHLYQTAKEPDCKFRLKTVAALIVLYAKKGDSFRARFLYSFFIKPRSLKSSRLFSRLRKKIGRQSEDEFCYDVLLDAFKHLPPQESYALMVWASPLFPSPQAGNLSCDLTTERFAVYGFYLAKILQDPQRKGNWGSFVGWLLREECNKNYQNKYLAVACEMIARTVFTRYDHQEIREHLLLLLRSAPEKIDPALIYYACEYAARYDDEELAALLLKALERGSVTIPQGKSSPEINALCEHCLVKVEEIQAPLYADLLIRLKPRALSLEQLELICPIATNKKPLFDRIATSFWEERDPKTIDRLLALLKPEGPFSYQGNAIKGIWKDVILGECRKNFEYLGDEEFDSFKQACLEILEDYPQTDSLEKYIKHSDNPLFRIALCAQFVNVYNERTVGNLFKINLDADTLCADPALLRAYLELTEKQCYAQLHYNRSYEAFYKHRRYLKLITVAAIRGGNDLDKQIECIDKLIETNNHRSLTDYYGYEEFKDIVFKGLLTIPDIAWRNHLLLSLMLEDIEPHFQKYANRLEAMAPDMQAAVKKAVRFFDFRDLNARFFLRHMDLMRAGDYDSVLKQAGLLSDEMYEIVKHLSDSNNPDLLEETRAIFAQKNYAEAVNTILNDKQKRASEEAQKFWSCVICAKQLPSKIIDVIRFRVLQNGMTADPDTDIEFEMETLLRFTLNSQKSYYDESVEACSQYLTCLWQYLCGIYQQPWKQRKIEANKASIDPKKLPMEWQSEAKRFKEFDWTEEGFEPDAIYRSSFHTAKHRVDFPALLDLSYEEIEEPDSVYELYQSATLDTEERIRTGLALLNNPGGPLPEAQYEDLALSVGNLILQSDRFTPRQKLEVWLELTDRNPEEEELRSRLEEFCEDLSIEDWLEKHEELYSVLGNAFRGSYDYCQGILSYLQKELKVASLDKKDCSATHLLQALKGSFTVKADNYVEHLQKAVDRRCEELKRRTLDVSFEGIVPQNNETATLYFCLINQGSETIHLGDRIQIHLGDSLSNTRVEVGTKELHPGWITGCRYQIDWNGQEELSLTILVRDADKNALPLYRGKETVRRSALPNGAVSSIHHEPYETERAVSQSEQLFGREDKIQDITEALDKRGYAIITGPSRIGKTSIMNHLSSLARSRGNVITVTLGDSIQNNYARPFYQPQGEIGSIADYLLSDTLRHGLDPKHHRMSCPDPRFLEELREKVRKIFDDHAVALENKYKSLDEYLAQKKLALWLMFDEFQQVVEQSHSDEELSAIMDVLDKMSRLEIKNIKLIFCGSDTLHKAIKSSENANGKWRNVLAAGNSHATFSNWVQVGAITPDAFRSMLKHPTLSYSEKALAAAATYSAGIPLYGKMICNSAIETLNKDSQRTRNTLYCYDIAIAAAEGVFGTDPGGIINAVIKGLELVDVLCLKYLAANLQGGKTLNGTLSDLRSLCTETTLNGILEYAMDARRIVTGDKTKGYDFSSVFFYHVFCKSANGSPEEILEDLSDALYGNADQAVEKLRVVLNGLDQDRQTNVLSKVNSTVLANATKMNLEALGEVNRSLKENDLGAAIHVEGDYIEKQENHISVQINQRNINLLTTGNPDDPDYMNVLKKVFSLEQSLGKEKLERIHQLQGEIQQAQDRLKTCYEGEIIPEEREEEAEVHQQEINRIEKELENEIKSKKEKQAQAIMGTISLDDLLNTTDKTWKNLLNIEQNQIDRIRSLSKYTAPFNFAIQIHNVLIKTYQNIETYDPGDDEGKKAKKAQMLAQVDFSSAAILYCKIIEAILNDEHKKLYVKCFPDKPYRLGMAETFSKLGLDSLTIGEFAYWIYKKQNRQSLAVATRTNADRWRIHSNNLNTIRDIRNDVAHKSDPMSYHIFHQLIKTMFEKGEFLLIWDLAHPQN